MQTIDVGIIRQFRCFFGDLVPGYRFRLSSDPELLRVPASVQKIIDTYDVFKDRYRRYVDNGLNLTW